MLEYKKDNDLSRCANKTKQFDNAILKSRELYGFLSRSTTFKVIESLV